MFNHKIIAIQSDWGGEYEHLNSLFCKVGITHQVSCPHTHQQNGDAECKHCHIVEMVLALLTHASMPLKYWDEAFLAAVYLINLTPTKLLSYDTPLHRLLGATPDYSSFHVFGCACWPNLCPYNSHKLEPRSTHYVFLGYNNMHKGFKCLDISKGCVYISRDVIFDESMFPFATLHPNAGVRYTFDVLLTSPRNDENVNLANAYTMTMLHVEFYVQVLQHARIPRVEATDQVPHGLPDPPVPTVVQFPEAPSPVVGNNNQASDLAPTSTSTNDRHIMVQAPALSPTRPST
jgi:hypothetical protein